MAAWCGAALLVVALYRRVEPGSGLGARSQAELGGRPRGVLGVAVIRSVAVTARARRLRAAPRRGVEMTMTTMTMTMTTTVTTMTTMTTMMTMMMAMAMTMAMAMAMTMAMAIALAMTMTMAMAMVMTMTMTMTMAMATAMAMAMAMTMATTMAMLMTMTIIGVAPDCTPWWRGAEGHAQGQRALRRARLASRPRDVEQMMRMTSESSGWPPWRWRRGQQQPQELYLTDLAGADSSPEACREWAREVAQAWEKGRLGRGGARAAAQQPWRWQRVGGEGAAAAWASSSFLVQALVLVTLGVEAAALTATLGLTWVEHGLRSWCQLVRGWTEATLVHGIEAEGAWSVGCQQHRSL